MELQALVTACCLITADVTAANAEAGQGSEVYQLRDVGGIQDRVLTLHSLFKKRSHKAVEPWGASEAAGQGCPPGDGVVAERWAEAPGRGGDFVASRAEGTRRRVKSPVEDKDGEQRLIVFSSLDTKLTCRQVRRV
ncbi:hypothetical protein PAMP_000039 [Pampus punctatissimus]